MDNASIQEAANPGNIARFRLIILLLAQLPNRLKLLCPAIFYPCFKSSMSQVGLDLVILTPQPRITGMSKHAWLAAGSLVINFKISYSWAKEQSISRNLFLRSPNGI